MTTNQIIAMARKKILEQTEEIFSNDDLLLYANLAKDDVAMMYLGKKLIKPTTLSFSSGIATKPTDWNGHYFSKDSNTPNSGKEYKLVSIEDFQSGKYPYMICESEDTMLVFPTTISTIYTWYYAKLADMAITPVVVNPPTALNSMFHKAIMYYVVAQAFEDAQDFELSKYFEDKAEKEYEKRAEAVSQLEQGTQEAGTILNQLPDLNFSGFGGNAGYIPSNDPNYF